MAVHTDQFGGIRLKRERAWAEINRLKKDMKAFLNGTPEPYVPRISFNGPTHTLTISAHVQRAPDPMWGVRIGEVIHNFRSALDHAVWELYTLANLTPPPRRSKNQFAIFNSKAAFENTGVERHLKGLSRRAVELIRAEQPFPASDGGTGEGDESPLWQLSELSNADKHRTLQVTGTLLESFNFSFPPLKHDCRIDQQQRTGPGPIQEDSVLARAVIHGATKWPFADNKVKATLGMDIAFDQNTPAVGGWLAVDTLIDIGNRADRILRRIAEEMFRFDL